MTTVKLPKSERMKLIDAVNNQEGTTIKLSSRMIVNPDLGVNGSVSLPLTKTQLAKLDKSQRATNFNLSKSQVMKLIKGKGFFGSLWSGIKTAGKFVGKTVAKVGEKVAPLVLDKLVDTAVAAAPALIAGLGNPEPVNPKGRMVKGSLGVARFRQPANSLSATHKMKGKGIGEPIFNTGGTGGEKYTGKVKRKDAPYKVNQIVSGDFFISGT